MTPVVARWVGVVEGNGKAVPPSPGVTVPGVALGVLDMGDGDPVLDEVPPAVCANAAPDISMPKGMTTIGPR